MLFLVSASNKPSFIPMLIPRFTYAMTLRSTTGWRNSSTRSNTSDGAGVRQLLKRYDEAREIVTDLPDQDNIERQPLAGSVHVFRLQRRLDDKRPRNIPVLADFLRVLGGQTDETPPCKNTPSAVRKSPGRGNSHDTQFAETRCQIRLELRCPCCTRACATEIRVQDGNGSAEAKDPSSLELPTLSGFGTLLS